MGIRFESILKNKNYDIEIKIQLAKENYYSLTNENNIDELTQNYFYDFYGIIVLSNEKAERTEIGKIYGTCINIQEYDINEDASFVRVCDEINPDIYSMSEAITDIEGNFLEEIIDFDKLLYLDRIFIDKDYRNNGIGTYIIENLNTIFKFYCNFYFDAIILQAKPQEIDDDFRIQQYVGSNLKLRQRKLIDFYKRLRFCSFKDTSYMIRIE